MADYINMQQTEYDVLQTDLAALQEDIISNEAKIRELIIELVGIEGGFYISMISEKISFLMSEMQAGPMTQLESDFESSREAISAFVDAVIQIDVVDM